MKKPTTVQKAIFDIAVEELKKDFYETGFIGAISFDETGDNEDEWEFNLKTSDDSTCSFDVGSPSSCEQELLELSIYRPTGIIKYFKYDHLPEHLQAVSKPFCDLAIKIDELSRVEPEESLVALRKLLEAKDAAVRAAL